jgi:serine/threonine protein phosphatase PrpC
MQFYRGVGVEEVADAFLTFVFDGVGGHFFSCV